ncbi:Nucleoside-diphosphate-sugar epimerase [Microbulbifer donghaiensis]|uniref:Nucleoside-diphosphate-sugar epimerase n=1 Tax=Microbulbifer donghaiensis TaxID=494016 RepID=A0A1M4W707_9GAMM|nr:NAD-dependent epimerase/dehydratase family protein [Microbulbifer donghaiensis]SHE77051.1 Nucleoside-diphosphate-sugar epimerase [Microbulbifer donghaiensis]
MARWVVIGGTGYIGEALCRRLASDGQLVLSVSRAPNGPEGCDHRSLSLTPDGDFSSLFQTGDRVIYAAGLAGRSDCERSPGLARWLNSDCPTLLLRFAEAAGAESFTYLSSVKAVCPPQGRVADEDTGSPAKDVYGYSKWLGEQQLLSEQCRCRVNLVRPAAVYGCENENAQRGGKAGRWRGRLSILGRLAPVLPASGRRSVINLQDLVRAIVLLAEAEYCDRQVYIVAEPNYYDLAGIILALTGVHVRTSRRLTSLVLAPLRPLRGLSVVRALLELEQSELYSAARLRRALPWRAEERYSQFLQGVA